MAKHLIRWVFKQMSASASARTDTIKLSFDVNDRSTNCGNFFRQIFAQKVCTIERNAYTKFFYVQSSWWMGKKSCWKPALFNPYICYKLGVIVLRSKSFIEFVPGQTTWSHLRLILSSKMTIQVETTSTRLKAAKIKITFQLKRSKRTAQKLKTIFSTSALVFIFQISRVFFNV